MAEECELCGNISNTQLYRIEGAEVLACASCGKFGTLVEVKSASTHPVRTSTTIGTSEKQQKSPLNKEKAKTKPLIGYQQKKLETKSLSEGFGSSIQRARENLGLTRKELAESLFIRETLLARIEAEKMRPDDELINKIEKTLEISLFETADDTMDLAQYNQKMQKAQGRSLTLGDFAHIRKKKGT